MDTGALKRLKILEKLGVVTSVMKFGSQIEVGIPSFMDFEAPLKLALGLRKAGFEGKIHISVNGSDLIPDPYLAQAFECAARLTIQKSNLGLYGNFKFLVDSATAEWFTWLAVDDEPNLVALQSPMNDGFDLLYFNFMLVRTMSSGGPAEEFGIKDPFESKNFFTPEPSAIFGIWRTEWLSAIFPAKAFDWLDIYLLVRTRAHGRLSKGPGVQKIGFQEKVPHSVNGRFHAPLGWTIHSLPSLRVRPLLIKDFLLACLGFTVASALGMWSWIRGRDGRQEATAL